MSALRSKCGCRAVDRESAANGKYAAAQTFGLSYTSSLCDVTSSRMKASAPPSAPKSRVFGAEMPCSLRLHGGSATTSKHSSSGGGGGGRSAAQGMPSSIAAQRQGIYDDSGMEQPSAVAPRRARVQVAPYDSYSEDVTTKGKISDLPSIEPVASRSPETLSQGARKAMTRALSLSTPALAAEVELTLCESVRIVADGAVSSKAPRSVEAFAAPVGGVVAALAALVGQPQSEVEATTLLETARLLVLGLGAGRRAKGALDVFHLASDVAKMRPLAGRASLVQVRDGCAPAEQGMQLALIEAALRTLPRPRQRAKAAKAVFTLALAVASSACTLSIDPKLLSSLRDCVHLAGEELQRRLSVQLAMLGRMCDYIWLRASRPDADQDATLDGAILQCQVHALGSGRWHAAAAFAHAIGAAALVHARRVQSAASPRSRSAPSRWPASCGRAGRAPRCLERARPSSAYAASSRTGPT